MRMRSTIQRLLLYATFFAISVALHMVVILGSRPADESTNGAAAVSSTTAQVESSQ